MSNFKIKMPLKRADIITLERLYDKYAPSLYGAILKLTPDLYTAGKILEASFKTMWLERDSYSVSKSSLFIWMLGITIQHASVLLCVPKKELMNEILVTFSGTSAA